MDINVTVKPGDIYRVLVNGALVCEGVGATAEGPSALENELKRARGARVGMRYVAEFVTAIRAGGSEIDHTNKTPDGRRAALLRGVLAGVTGAEHDHPGNPLLKIEPEHSASYILGYDIGRTLTRALEAARPEPGGAYCPPSTNADCLTTNPAKG